MQCESSPREEEIPSLFWGLDPVFLAFAKLYIRDILEMKESHQISGIYLYNGHPIRRVDIMGTVISVREKDAFYSYGDPAAPSTARELSVTSQLKKLQETIEQKTKIEIGDVIRVRGYVHMFREEREIRASMYYKVDDPVWSIQIARMLELPALYERVYDQPFRSPALKDKEAPSNTDTLDLAGLTSLLSEKIKEFLQDKKVQTFYQQELEMVESLQSLASQPVLHSACSDQVESKNSTTSDTVHSVFKNAIQLLREKGLLFQKDGGGDKLYYVTNKNKELHQKIYQIIKEECQKPTHVEKGCHVMHILSCVRLNLRWDLNKAVLQQVLEFLEDQSDIVSTGAHYYTAF
ncbi:CST complex subunit STN1 isoform X2 [Peromyscus leucopus]|uniref:CST complex subunit STN1 isoform X2 n=1 Tax=Peromyscus leucopus TaxID=10041 RepID=UPI0018856D22|nr:CST complex subunit STN1 isoform X2 [Peromyscus leucopus]